MSADAAPTFVYLEYGPAPHNRRELRYSLATLLAEYADAPPRVLVYTDKPDAYEVLCSQIEPVGIANELTAWTREGLLPHRAKACALRDAIRRVGGVCVLVDTDTFFEPGFRRALEQQIARGPAMDHFEEMNPFPQATGFAADLPHSGRYEYCETEAQMCNSGLVAVDAARDGAAIGDALALIDAYLDSGLRSFKIEQVSFSETLRRLGLGVGEMRPAFQHYFRRSLKRYMRWRLEAWEKRTPVFAPTRPFLRPSRNTVRLFNVVNRIVGRF